MPRPAPTIRAPRPEDAEALAALLAELGYPTEPDLAWARIERLAGEVRATALVADEGGAPVGLAACVLGGIAPGYAADDAQLAVLVVSAGARRRGVGRALVAATTAWACSRGCRRLTVATGPERAAARAFYERLGFTPVGMYHALMLAL